MPLIYPVSFMGGLREPIVTWDPANKDAGVTLSNSNFDAVGSAAKGLRATKGISGSQKAYFEIHVVTAVNNGGRVGVINHSTYNNYGGLVSQSATMRIHTSGNFLGTGTTAGSNGDVSATSTGGDVIMVAVDMGAGKYWSGVNGTWYNSGSPSAGTNAQYTALSGTHYPSADFLSTEKWRIRGNTNNITYSPPSGFSVLGAL